MLDGLRITDLALSRGDRLLFSQLFLELNRGQAVSLTGGNGAGKSSLLRAIAGFIRPDAGQIAFVGNGGEVEADEARRRGLHLTGHLEGLKPTRTARQEMDFQNRFLGGSPEGIARAIELLHLEPLLDLETRRLSAGQKRRVSMARLISVPRPLWLLDEPLAPLDSVWRQRMGELMQAHLADGGMIIAAVHDPLPFTTVPFDLGGRA